MWGSVDRVVLDCKYLDHKSRCARKSDVWGDCNLLYMQNISVSTVTSKAGLKH